MKPKTEKLLQKIRYRDGRAAAERTEKMLRQAAREGTMKHALRKLAK